MSRRCNVVVCIILYLAVPTANLKSQISKDHHPWWISVGCGPSLIGNTFSASAGMVYSYQFTNSVVSGRILGLTNINPTVLQIAPATEKYKMADYGVLYGPLWHYEHSFLSIGTGIGLVRATHENITGSTINTSISLPLEVQWFWQPTHFVGFGVYTYANFNFEKQLFGIMLCAQLGVW